MLDIKEKWKSKEKKIPVYFHTSYTFYLKMIIIQHCHWVKVVKSAILDENQILNGE